MIIALFAIVGTASADSYGLYVGGVEVTDENKADILGNGTAVYNSEANKLTLNNANITEAYDFSSSNGWYAGICVIRSGLKILLEGSNSIKFSKDKAVYIYGIESDYDITFSGTGSLNIELTSTLPYCGIRTNNGDVTINGGEITVSSQNKDAVRSDKKDIVINGGKLTVSSKGNGYNGLYAQNDITVNGGTVTVTMADNGIYSGQGRVNVKGGTVDATSKWGAIDGCTGLSVYSSAVLREGDAAPGEVVSALTNTGTLPQFYSKNYVKIAPTGTGITATDAAEKVVSEQWFTTSGAATSATSKGVVIRKTTYTDGTVKTDKVRK